ncbi:GntR family transcriptional regulator [Isobaculum melis]|uniref:DNA-binding transcriptional regulator, GntR family n=1 Tax=Isobaculum melis TaxID=142588 RepID=A0A1H9Q073_9LACT|nr:GntR family transcriptional regulator [Isobaculum melis]SER53243.1 DNA-binding transcriptional regulator, GntR family [Isobaculum melis]
MKPEKEVYQQVAHQIKQEIIKGIYPVGAHIPTEIILENKFKVSKITIRKAIDLLVADGYVQKKTGIGTVVLSNRLFNKLTRVHSFVDILKAQGLILTNDSSSITKIALKKDHPLYAIFGSECLSIIEIFLLNGLPYLLLEHFIPLQQDKDLISIQTELEQTTLTKWLTKNQQSTCSFTDSFTIGKLSKQQQKVFSTNEANMLQRIRKVYTPEQKIIQVTYSFYNTELTPYIIEYEV